jgi:PAS domain S-box-containing protein
LASHLILAFGVLLSGAFAYTVRLAQGLRRRARELEREVEERIKAEQELEDGRADLERTVEARTQELEISQERFALSIRGSGDGIWEFDPGRRENWYSSRFEEMLGYAEGEIPNTLEASIELLHPEDREAANEGFIRHLKDDTPYDIEYRLRTKSGDYRWVRARAKSLRDANGRATRTSGSTTDIDEQKQAEERLLRNERQFVMILEAAPVGVTVTDSKSKRVVVNQRYADIVGIPRDELLGSSAANVWAREEDRAEYARRFAEDNRVVDMEFEMKRSDGSSAWVMANAISLDFFGEPVRVNWVVELTDRKETEEALRESETRLLEILDQSPYGVSIVSRKTKQRLYGNRRMKEMVAGGPDVALDGREIADSYAEPEKMEENWALFERDGMITGTEELRKHANGSTWWCLSDWRPVKFGDEDAVMVWHYDITERTEAAEALQKALRQAEQFNKLTVDRELRMIEMKKEVDELLEKLGEEARYSGL